MTYLGNSLAAQWLRHHTSTAESMGLISGQQTRMPHAAHHSQKKEKYTHIHIMYTHMHTHTHFSNAWTERYLDLGRLCGVCVWCVCVCVTQLIELLWGLKDWTHINNPEQYLSHKLALPIVIIAVAVEVKWGNNVYKSITHLNLENTYKIQLKLIHI